MTINERMGQYKTLKQIDGQQYISLIEHEEIIQGIMNLNQAFRSVQDSLGTVNRSVAGLSETLNGKTILKG